MLSYYEWLDSNCLDDTDNNYDAYLDYKSSCNIQRIRLSPYERTKAQVYATGNKWAIENFNATH